jgi:hypothetical protein
LAVALIAAVLAGAAGVAVVARRAASLPAPAPLAKTIEQLNAELDSGDPDVRRQAARELGQRLGATSREQRP